MSLHPRASSDLVANFLYRANFPRETGIAVTCRSYIRERKKISASRPRDLSPLSIPRYRSLSLSSSAVASLRIAPDSLVVRRCGKQTGCFSNYVSRILFPRGIDLAHWATQFLGNPAAICRVTPLQVARINISTDGVAYNFSYVKEPRETSDMRISSPLCVCVCLCVCNESFRSKRMLACASSLRLEHLKFSEAQIAIVEVARVWSCRSWKLFNGMQPLSFGFNHSAPRALHKADLHLAPETAKLIALYCAEVRHLLRRAINPCERNTEKEGQRERERERERGGRLYCASLVNSRRGDFRCVLISAGACFSRKKQFHDDKLVHYV